MALHIFRAIGVTDGCLQGAELAVKTISQPDTVNKFTAEQIAETGIGNGHIACQRDIMPATDMTPDFCISCQ